MRKASTILVVILALILCGCGDGVSIEPQGERQFGEERARVEEVSFRSGDYVLVGDLRIPTEGGSYPAIIMVHGDGHATRHGSVPFEPLIEIFLRSGFAVFSWDKPGDGESTGEINDWLGERSSILVDGLSALAEHPAIEPNQIGLWGISQAGWVMPRTLERTDDVAFMIVVSGGAEDVIEQEAYQLGRRLLCAGGSSEQAEIAEEQRSRARKATTYDEYRSAMEILQGIPGIEDYVESGILEEEDWEPLPRDWDLFWDPMDVIERSDIPVLAFFGELDMNIDPIQGADAYRAALEEAGSRYSQVVLISGVAHLLRRTETGCQDLLGTGPQSQEYVPEYLIALEDWLWHLPVWQF
jgi:pimeloyl-ACP methyl ester carboxylesterase